MHYLYAAAKAEGRYRSKSGHRATPGYDFADAQHYACAVCGSCVTRSDSARSGWRHVGHR
jgi:hypothetical protein